MTSLIFAIVVFLELVIYFFGTDIFGSRPIKNYDTTNYNDYSYTNSYSNANNNYEHDGLGVVPNIGEKVAQTMIPSKISYPSIEEVHNINDQYRIEKLILATIIVGGIVVFAMPNKRIKRK